MYHIILLRHGESTGNTTGIHQGHADYPLSERGQAQARALAEFWRRSHRRFDQIIASPLVRARQTAEIIGAALQAHVELSSLWMEYNIGRHTGLIPETARQLYPQPAFMTPYDPVGETGESRWEVFLRAGQAVQELLCLPAGRYLVVSHGGLLNMVMYAILGIVPHANFQGPRFPLRNTAYITLTYEPGLHKWRILGTNERSHWVEEAEN